MPVPPGRASIAGRVLQGLGVTILVAAAVGIAIRLVEVLFHIPGTSATVEAFEVAGVLVVGYTLSHRLGAAIKAWAAQNNRFAQVTAIGLFVDLLVAAGVVLALFAVFNVGLSTLLFGGALTGVILALASQTLLANVFSGLILAVAAPFHHGDRISIISANYGALAPTYAHELLYPAYTGRVVQAGLFYTTMVLDSGRIAKVPNSVVIASLVVVFASSEAHLVRVRLTLPHLVSPGALVDAVAHPARPYSPVAPGHDGPQVRVADVSAASWDGLVSVWTTEPDDEKIRDEILAAVQPVVARLAGLIPATSTGTPAPLAAQRVAAAGAAGPARPE
ncbi:MAG TPA: mechanosensitive ion channel family protein [Thermoplasmata archaeon]|nr:mechanosensitive ion channel family protein [Thermoplasmata archaeon]